MCEKRPIHVELICVVTLPTLHLDYTGRSIYRAILFLITLAYFCDLQVYL